jgi:hypothetical protein
MKQRLAAFAAFVSLAVPAAHAQVASFEEWSVDWSPGFADDFADGVFTSGPGEAYNVACGSANETGGRLVVGTATTPCAGFEIRPQALVPGGLVLRALVSLPTTAEPTPGTPNPPRIAPTTQARVGIAVRDQAGTDAVFLHVRRSNDEAQECADIPAPDTCFGTGGNDVLYVELGDEAGDTVSRTYTLTQNPTSSPDLPNAYELELTLTPDGDVLLPSARFRECKTSYLSGGPCAPADPILDLVPETAPPTSTSVDAGALDAGDSHVPAFYANAPGGAFAVRLDDWDLAMDAADDFETPPLGSTLPYQTSTGLCGTAAVGSGALALGAQDGCPKVIAAAAGSLASEAVAAATLRYTLPARCEMRGATFSIGADQANLALVRDADGSLAVWLTGEAVGGGPAVPLVEQATLSATPASDATLLATDAVELRLALASDGLGGLVPHGQYRLCPTSPCAPGVAFVDLDAATEPPAPGNACFDVGLASDGGVAADDVPVAASLQLVPEPHAVAGALAAALALSG